jgi:hypothetical protein
MVAIRQAISDYNKRLWSNGCYIRSLTNAILLFNFSIPYSIPNILPNESMDRYWTSRNQRVQADLFWDNMLALISLKSKNVYFLEAKDNKINVLLVNFTIIKVKK